MSKNCRSLGSLTVAASMAAAILSIPFEDTRCEEKFGAKQLTFGSVAEIEPNISPDGRWIAFQYFAEKSPRLAQIGVMDTSKGFASARPLVDQHGYAAEMSWSPDSKWISFISSENKPSRNTDQIYRINVATKEIVQITNFPEGTLIGDSTTWARNGLIAFERDGEIFGIPDVGGKEMLLFDPRTAVSNQRPSNIRLSPDGKMLLFSVENEQQDLSEIWLADLGSRSLRQLTSLHFDLFPAWIDEGHILFSRETKRGLSEVHLLSLRTGHLERITCNHVDFASSTDASGEVLYLSRKDPVSKESDNGGFFFGFHIWRIPIPRKMLR